MALNLELRGHGPLRLPSGTRIAWVDLVLIFMALFGQQLFVFRTRGQARPRRERENGEVRSFRGDSIVGDSRTRDGSGRV